MQTAPFQSIVTQLTGGQTPRVWSLLVTVFGELAQDQGARISGSLLRRICAGIGIKPEAMRVALHRLRKDGWVESERSGRTSTYFLTDWGRAQSAQASPRIYSADPAARQAWLVVCNPGQSQALEPCAGVWIASNLVVSAQLPAVPDVFTTPLDANTPLPDWIKSKLCDEVTVTMSQNLAEVLTALRAQLDAMPDLKPLEVTALRVLLVHSWRRIVLRAPVLPDDVFPQDWRGGFCRAQVSDLLHRYSKPDLATLDRALTTDSGA